MAARGAGGNGAGNAGRIASLPAGDAPPRTDSAGQDSGERWRPSGSGPLHQGLPIPKRGARYYLCRGGACAQPQMRGGAYRSRESLQTLIYINSALWYDKYDFKSNVKSVLKINILPGVKMKTAYTNGKILNGHEDMTPVTGLAVLVDKEEITGIIPNGEVSAEYTAVDLQGGYLMPGLINFHVYIPDSGKPAKKQANTKKLVKQITSNGLTQKIGMNMCASFAQDGADELSRPTSTDRCQICSEKLPGWCRC